MLQLPSSSESDNGASDSKRTLRRQLGLGASAIGAPTFMCFVDPTLGLILTVSELAAILIVLATALFGTPTFSDRAFRVLRWLADRPEHAAPPVPPAVAQPGASRAGGDL